MSEFDEHQPVLDYNDGDVVGEEEKSKSSPIRNSSKDELLPLVNDDPRARQNAERQRVGQKSGGRNTESFDPKSTLVRPEMRILVGPNKEHYGKSLKHDDVVIVPNFFCDEDDWSMYYQLIEEMRGVQANGSKQSEWISWHEGAHLITKNPADCPSFKVIQDKISSYFNIAQKSVGTRFNWYRDSSDWKPFHHDSAAFNPQRAKNQNITVGVSFGATRELAFIHAENKSRVYFPQTNGMMFSFGRDVNITWKHGVNALPENEQDGKGRVSIILWGLCPDVIEEKNSPRMISNERNFGGKGGKVNGGRGGGRDDRRPFERERSRDRDKERGRDYDRDRGGDRFRNRSRDDMDRRGRNFRRDRADSRGGYRGDSRRGGSDRNNGHSDGRDRYQDSHGAERGRPRDTDRDNDRRRGDDRESNAANGHSQEPKENTRDKVCFSFQKGECKYGDSCKFSHANA